MNNYHNSEDSSKSNFQLCEFIEEFKKWTSIHNIYSLKKIIEKIENNKISHKMLVDSLELLADSSVFKYYSIEVISELELHLRTLVSLIEVICKCEIRIRHDLREKIYAQLGKFAEIHFRSTEVNEQGFNKVFKPQFDNFNPSSKSTASPDLFNSNGSKIYKDGKRNYNIDFLLLHLRDTLHCMRDDENKFLEVWRRIKELLHIILGITPGLIRKGISHGADLPIDSGIELLFKHLQSAFTWKYPISTWYYEWRTLLELHFNIQNFLQECSLPSKYGESLILECLWHCVSKSWSNPISQSNSLTNKKHFVNNLLGMEPLAFPYSLWFGALYITQNLIAKSQKDSTLGICYYLALESLQKAPSSFIRFKAIEVLIKLSKRNMLFYNIIDSDFENYKQSLDSVKGLKSHNMIEAILDTNKNNVNDSKENGKAITIDSLKSEISIDDFILKIVTTELSCPVTCKISKNFQILSCCKHLISSEALQQIINNKSQPTCPFCRKLIDLNSVINLPQSAIYQGIRNYLPEDNNVNTIQNYDENISNESSDDEINISKLKSQQNFSRSNSTVKKFFKTPKFLHSSLRKANAAYRLGNLEIAINELTEILEEYPTSYSL
ncbi:24432_t:CDS:2 [Gigaspora rosea]|nr:24432_t:CDS:2 [Gigaspora rosea]